MEVDLGMETWVVLLLAALISIVECQEQDQDLRIQDGRAKFGERISQARTLCSGPTNCHFGFTFDDTDADNANRDNVNNNLDTFNEFSKIRFISPTRNSGPTFGVRFNPAVHDPARRKRPLERIKSRPVIKPRQRTTTRKTTTTTRRTTTTTQRTTTTTTTRRTTTTTRRTTIRTTQKPKTKGQTGWRRRKEGRRVDIQQPVLFAPGIAGLRRPRPIEDQFRKKNIVSRTKTHVVITPKRHKVITSKPVVFKTTLASFTDLTSLHRPEKQEVRNVSKTKTRVVITPKRHKVITSKPVLFKSTLASFTDLTSLHRPEKQEERNKFHILFPETATGDPGYSVNVKLGGTPIFEPKDSSTPESTRRRPATISNEVTNVKTTPSTFRNNLRRRKTTQNPRKTLLKPTQKATPTTSLKTSHGRNSPKAKLPNTGLLSFLRNKFPVESSTQKETTSRRKTTRRRKKIPPSQTEQKRPASFENKRTSFSNRHSSTSTTSSTSNQNGNNSENVTRCPGSLEQCVEVCIPLEDIYAYSICVVQCGKRCMQ